MKLQEPNPYKEKDEACKGCLVWFLSFAAGVSITLALFFLTSCEKEQPQPTPNTSTNCDCHERHEAIETVVVNGNPQPQWVLQYETPAIPAPCTNETDWYYNQQNTERWRTICQ